MRVNRHVRLVRPLKSGAMGSLWVGEHLTLETQVAVKFIGDEARFDHPDAARRFEVEAKATAQVRSPHVVQIFDHGTTEDGPPYIVMELLEGESLADRLERTGWLSFTQAEKVIRQVAAALAKAHEAGIVHRDVKPDNIFLCDAEDGPFVKLLDFGVAKSLRGMDVGLTSPGAMVGTAEYLSREQVVSAKAVDEQADLWSLAVVAYEALTGDVPFTGETLGLICIAICNGVFTPPSELRKGLSPALDAWFARAFHSDPRERFPSARVMADTFAEALRAGDAVGADELGPWSADAPRASLPARGRSSRPVSTATGIGPHAPSLPPPTTDAPGHRLPGASVLPRDRAGLHFDDPSPAAPAALDRYDPPSEIDDRLVPATAPPRDDARDHGRPLDDPSQPRPAPQGPARSHEAAPDRSRRRGPPTVRQIRAAPLPGGEAPGDDAVSEELTIPGVPPRQRRGALILAAVALLLVLGAWHHLRRVEPLGTVDVELVAPSVALPPTPPDGERTSEGAATSPAPGAVDAAAANTPATSAPASRTASPASSQATASPSAPTSERFDGRSDYGF